MKAFVFSLFSGQTLESHVPGRSKRANEILIILHSEDTILAIRKDEDISLAGHGLRSQSGSDQENFFTGKLFSHTYGELEALDLYQRVFLRIDTLSLGPVMISAWLAISFGENSMSLAEFEVPTILQLVELPFNEGAVERICISGYKRTSPVCEDTKFLQIQLALRGEKFRPIVCILEFWDFGIGYLKGLKDFELGRR